MPILGFGVFQIPDEKECERCINDAIHSGYRLIDTAASYMNEKAVGNAISQSGITRIDLFVTSKLWVQDHGYENTLRAFDKTLNRLKMDYLDLYLIHQPYGDVFGSWRAMVELYKAGKIRAIGVSNFQTDRVMDLMAFGEVTPAVNQIEVHPFHQQVDAHSFLTENKIQTEAWAPFAEGRNSMFDNEALKALSVKHKKSIAQIILRWLIQRKIVVIPKTTHKTRMVENMDVFDFELDEADLASIRTMDQKKSLFFDHRDPEIIKWMAARKLEI